MDEWQLSDPCELADEQPVDVPLLDPPRAPPPPSLHLGALDVPPFTWGLGDLAFRVRTEGGVGEGGQEEEEEGEQEEVGLAGWSRASWSASVSGVEQEAHSRRTRSSPSRPACHLGPDPLELNGRGDSN